jgi:hypothetical protein
VVIASSSNSHAHAGAVEARSALGAMAKGNVAHAAAYPPSTSRLCASAEHSVPASIDAVRARSYRSQRAEWGNPGDAGGFGCLQFSLYWPQRYLFDYRTLDGGSRFEAIAQGDLDGDGITSQFVYRGRLADGRVVMAPAIDESNPRE